jgi:hypothetical protein
MVGLLLGSVTVVVVDSLVMVDFVVVVEVVQDGSSVTVPITQYDLLTSRSGQEIPGFSYFRLSTDSPQLLAKLEHVSTASALMQKSQLTAWGVRAAAVAGIAPVARIAVRRIVLDLVLSYIGGKNAREYYISKSIVTY